MGRTNKKEKGWTKNTPKKRKGTKSIKAAPTPSTPKTVEFWDDPMMWGNDNFERFQKGRK